MKDLKPVIFKNREEAPQDASVVEAFDGAIRELFFIDHPKFGKKTPKGEGAFEDYKSKLNIENVWIYYPSTNVLVRTLPEDLYFHLRTARNRNLITEKEQINYRNTKVGIAGLSVGSSAISSIVLSGGPKSLKIADFDHIEISNLNRIRARLSDVGENKTYVTAREVWNVDPYADLHLYPDGVSRENLKDFITGDPRLDIMIDQMDNIELKIMTRFVSRENKIPVIMVTDNGDSIILDVERFDLEPNREIFHGLIGDIDLEKTKDLDFKKWLELATKIIGPEYLTEKMQDSVLEIGKTISAVPQLGPTASIAGASIAFAIRRISNGGDLPSGRYTMGLEENFIPNYMSEDLVSKRQLKTQEFLKKFGAGK